MRYRSSENGKIFTIPEYLKLTFLTLVENPSKQKVVSNVRTLFEYLDTDTLDVPNDSMLIIKLIQKAIEAIDMGIREKKAIFAYAIEDDTHTDMLDIKDRLEETLAPDTQNLIIEYLSTIILNKPIYDSASKLAELAVSINAKGISQSIRALKDYTTEVERVKREIDTIRASKVNDEIMVDSDYSIGLEKVAQDRDDENNIVLRMFGALNKLTGGGSRLRKSNLVIANTGCFKSGLLLNIALYMKEYAEVPEEFLDGARAVVLYITHENTLPQTACRVLAWYGYNKAEIDAMSTRTFEKVLHECLAPKANGIRLCLKYIDPGTITIKDIDNMCDDLKAANMKVIACCEDYLKHVLPDMREDEIASNVMSGDSIAIQASALARRQFLSFWTAAQFGREGNKVKEEAKEKGADYLKKMNTHMVSGSYNSTNSYESIYICDKGVTPISKRSFFAIKLCKDRDDRNDGDSDYYVMPFMKGGFRLHDTEYYTSVAEMDPAMSAIADMYTATLADISAELNRREALNKAMTDLKNIGYLESDLADMGEVDILERAKHLAQGGIVAVPVRDTSIPVSA